MFIDITDKDGQPYRLKADAIVAILPDDKNGNILHIQANAPVGPSYIRLHQEESDPGESRRVAIPRGKLPEVLRALAAAGQNFAGLINTVARAKGSTAGDAGRVHVNIDAIDALEWEDRSDNYAALNLMIAGYGAVNHILAYRNDMQAFLADVQAHAPNLLRVDNSEVAGKTEEGFTLLKPSAIIAVSAKTKYSAGVDVTMNNSGQSLFFGTSRPETPDEYKAPPDEPLFGTHFLKELLATVNVDPTPPEQQAIDDAKSLARRIGTAAALFQIPDSDDQPAFVKPEGVVSVTSGAHVFYSGGGSVTLAFNTRAAYETTIECLTGQKPLPVAPPVAAPRPA